MADLPDRIGSDRIGSDRIGSDRIGGDLLAAHLTAAVRHAVDGDVSDGAVAVDDQLLFALLRSALATAPRPGTVAYATRLAADCGRTAAAPRVASRYPDDYAAAA